MFTITNVAEKFETLLDTIAELRKMPAVERAERAVYSNGNFLCMANALIAAPKI